jgi:hypothetical protein
MSVAEYTLTSDEPVVSFELMNQGLLPVTWYSVGVPTSVNVTASTHTLTAWNTTVITLSAPASVFDIPTSTIWLLQLVPSGTATYDSCFESITMRIIIEPAVIDSPDIAFELNAALVVLAFVVTIIGSWISITLVEQVQSRIRDNKPYLVWFIACPLALTMCAIWPCVLIMMSSISVGIICVHVIIQSIDRLIYRELFDE